MSSESDLALSVRGLSKSYTIAHQQGEKHSTLAESLLAKARRPFRRVERETFWALRDVSFDIKKGDVVGIIGRNGAGKSTLLKILSRITEPTSGEIDAYGPIGSLLEVGTGFHPELTGRENIFLNGAILGMGRAEIRSQFDAIVEFAGVEKFLDTPVKRYSSGMYVRLAFAVAAHLRSDILIVDEVLAVGDAEFQKKCLGKMRDVGADGRTVLFVSHNMAAVRELCSQAVFLVAGKVQEVGKVDRIVRSYLDCGTPEAVRMQTGPLRSLRVAQDSDALVVEAEWQHTEPIRLPNLGFVIYDYMGTPIVGANPYLLGIDRADRARDKGRITARLTEPRLLDGQYFLSAWFGDGARDFVALPKCIAFDVRGMAGPRQYSATDVGAAAPRCTYEFC